MTSIVDDENFELYVYDLHPSDDVREAIDLYIEALDLSYSNLNLNINDYISIDKEFEDDIYINESSFNKDIDEVMKPYEKLNDGMQSLLLRIIVNDFNEKFFIYKEAASKGKINYAFPIQEWSIKEYDDKFSNQLIESLAYSISNINLPKDLSLEKKLTVLNPFIVRKLKCLNNSYFLSNSSKIEKSNSFDFLKDDETLSTSELIPDYIKTYGNIVDKYFYVSGKPYFLKDKLFLLALRDDPFIENKAYFYINKEEGKDNALSDVNLKGLFNYFLNANLENQENLESFKAFKEITGGLESLKEAKKNPNMKDKSMKTYLNALASYVNEMKDVINLENSDIEKYGIRLIKTIEKAFDVNNRLINDDKAIKSEYFEYFLMKVDNLNLEKDNKKTSKKIKKF